MILRTRASSLLRIIAETPRKFNFSSSTLIQPQQQQPERLELPDISKIGHIHPLEHPDYFNVNNLFTMREMFENRVHFGHKEGSLEDRMKPYLYGSRLGHLIIDLDQTAVALKRALNVTAHVAFQGGVILFFCRSALNAYNVEEMAKECGEYSHTRFWRKGTFTNSMIQFKAVTRLPDLCVFFSTLDTVNFQHQAVRDAAKMNIPSIGIVDTNCSPDLVTYVVPGNDDSPAAIDFYCRIFKEAVLRGKAKRSQFLEELEKTEKEE